MKERFLHILVVVAQILFGLTFVLSGLFKSIDPSGTAIKIKEYADLFGIVYIDDWAMGLSWLLCLAEMLIGVKVLLGHNRFFFYLGLIVIAVFTPFTFYLALTNLVDDCGCFGDAIKLSQWGTFYKNIVLLFCILGVLVYLQYIWKPLDQLSSTVYSYLVLFLGLSLCWIGTFRLPFIDFRPYKVGTILNESSEAEASYIIVYEKDGIRQEFALDSIPEADSGWEFVESIERRADAGAEKNIPTAEAFFLTGEDGSDVTHTVVGDTGYVFLLTSPQLAYANEHDLDRIEAIYEYAREMNYPFYMVTLRDSAQINQWVFRTGAEYPILYSDDRVITTINRANPGLLLLHHGQIYWKSCITDLDIPTLTSANLSEQTYGKKQEIDYENRFFWLLVCLFAPFFLFLLFQIPQKVVSLLNKKNHN